MSRQVARASWEIVAPDPSLFGTGDNAAGSFTTHSFIICHNMKAMAMTSLNISLPDPLKAYVEDRVASGDFGTPSEFVRSLIRQDKERRRERIETELLEALESKQLVLAPDEVRGRNIVDVLREKLARR